MFFFAAIASLACPSPVPAYDNRRGLFMALNGEIADSASERAIFPSRLKNVRTYAPAIGLKR